MSGAEASKLGTTERSDGTMQVTYAGHPLYTFVEDTKPGEAKGNDISAFGAQWYALEVERRGGGRRSPGEPAVRAYRAALPGPLSSFDAVFVWPAVSYEDWTATCDTLHAHTQVLGKLAAELAPAEPQLQHAALRLTARGWETAPLPAPDGCGALVVALDLHTPRGGGRAQRRALAAPAADAAPRGGRGDARAARRGRRAGRRGRDRPDPAGGAPGASPLDEDTEHATYEPEQVADYFAAATQAALVLAAFRAPYRGRSTPVNAWWGSFDLAVSLFSGLPAEPPSGRLHHAQRDGLPGGRAGLVAG